MESLELLLESGLLLLRLLLLRLLLLLGSFGSWLLLLEGFKRGSWAWAAWATGAWAA